MWAQVLEKVQSLAQQPGDLDWVASIDSTIVRVHQHGATLPRATGGSVELQEVRAEPPDHAIGRSRGGLTTKNHLVCDGTGRALAFILTPGQIADTSMLPATLEQIRVPGAAGGRAPGRTGCSPTRATRRGRTGRGCASAASLRRSRNATTRSPTAASKPGRPIDFGDEQRERYRGRNVVERCFNKLKQWRGIAMRSDKTARNYHAGLCLAATLHWLTSSGWQREVSGGSSVCDAEADRAVHDSDHEDDDAADDGLPRECCDEEQTADGADDLKRPGEPAVLRVLPVCSGDVRDEVVQEHSE